MAQLLTRSCSLQILLAMAQIEMTAIKRYSSYFLVTYCTLTNTKVCVNVNYIVLHTSATFSTDAMYWIYVQDAFGCLVDSIV